MIMIQSYIMEKIINNIEKKNHDFSLTSVLKKFKIPLISLIGLYIINECSMIFGPYTFSKILSTIEMYYKGQCGVLQLHWCNVFITGFWTVFILISMAVKIHGGILFNKIENYIKVNLFDFLHSISYEDFLVLTSEKAFNHLKVLEYSVREIFSICIVDMFANGFTIFINTIILFYLLPELGLLMTSWMFLHFFILKYFFRSTLLNNKNLITTKSLMINNILETLLNILMIKTTNTKEYEKEKLDLLVEDYTKSKTLFLLNAEKINTIALMICEICIWGGGVALIMYKITTISIPISKITYIMMTIYNIVAKVKNIGIKICKLFEHLGEYNIIFNMLHENKIPEVRDLQLFSNVNKNNNPPIIEFRNVSLSSKRAHILKNINLTIYSGEKVCFIGSSGCGKSTLVNLLCGLYKSYKGDILINGHNIKDISPKSIVDFLSITNQNYMLLTRSIRDNLVQNQNISESTLHHYCKIAQIHDFIMSLPKGYDTIINLKTISGGQAQRLCLARMLLRHKPINIFDESTNALDIKTQNEILSKILDEKVKYTEGIKETLIFVSHSLDFLNRMDRVILIEEGSIAINDTYENMKKNPLFHKLKDHIYI
jgi:subfamily B ATP-binding cassette protein MsbA